MKGIVHRRQSTERKSMVEDFCAERVEPTPELSVNKQTATLALKKSERK